VNGTAGLGQINATGRRKRRLTLVRVYLPLGWALAAVGFFGPWVAHAAAGLTLSGVDMGEFVKFLPGALDGTLAVFRQLFYLPPFAITSSIAMLVGSPRLGYSPIVRTLALVSAVPVSLQLLPPAWSPSSLLAPEFRLQTIVLGTCWLLLAGFWLLARLPSWLTGSLSTAVSLAASVLPFWQYWVIKPAVDEVYGRSPAVGWGVPACLVGLLIMAAMSSMFALRSGLRSTVPWSGE
jgi:hypothetical protein